MSKKRQAKGKDPIHDDPEFRALVEGLRKQTPDRIAKLQDLVEGMEEEESHGNESSDDAR